MTITQTGDKMDTSILQVPYCSKILIIKNVPSNDSLINREIDSTINSLSINYDIGNYKNYYFCYCKKDYPDKFLNWKSKILSKR